MYAKPDDEDRFSAWYTEARRLMRLAHYRDALTALELLLARAQPAARDESEQGVLAPYQDWPEALAQPVDVAGGVAVCWVPDYYVAALYLAGRCFYALKYYETAATCLEEAANHWPCHLGLHSELAVVYASLERYGDALLALRVAAAIEPENIVIRAQLDAVAARLGPPGLKVSMI